MVSSTRSSVIPTLVLSSYQGAAFVVEQLASLREQTHQTWRLLVRDDGSQDDTPALLRQEAQRDERIVVVEDGQGRLGPARSYSRLLERALDEGADWVALCDQDDWWLPQKLGRLVERAEELDSEAPWLLHSDLSVVGPDLELRHRSLFASMGLRHESEHALQVLMVQNFVTGCSAFVSRGLLEAALPVPASCVMHDWWLALCAAAEGRIAFETEPLVLYRQHAGNALGARSLVDSVKASAGRAISRRRSSPQEFLATLRQAAALERHLMSRSECGQGGSRLAESLAFLAGYLDLFRTDSGRLRRVVSLQRWGVKRQSLLLDASLKLRLLTWSNHDPSLAAAAVSEASA